MAKQQWDGAALLAPVPPVLVTCGTKESPNICTAAWCGMLNSKPPITYISLRPERHSFDLIMQNNEFVLNLPTQPLVKTVDWCGVKSGRDHNKFADCRLHTSPAFTVEPPLLDESPLALECRVRTIEPLGSHHMFIADITAVAVDESLLDEEGRLQLDRAKLLTYAHGEYFALGQKLGGFGYSVRKRKPRKNK